MMRKTFLYCLAAFLLNAGSAHAVNVATWTFVDGNGANGVNKSTTRDATSPQITSFNKNFYAIWTERDATNNVRQVRVAVYNELDLTPAWSFVDGNGITGINKDTSRTARNPQLTVLGRKLYATWREDNGAADQIRVAVYNGNDLLPAWTFVDGNGANGINKDTGRNASESQFELFLGKIYVTWAETNGGTDQIRVAMYNGNDLLPVWTFVDGNGTNGINKDVTYSATSPQLTMHKGVLYATWREDNGTASQIRAAAFGGNVLLPTWTFVDGNSATTGLNKNTGLDASVPQFARFSNKLYATWVETNGTNSQIRMVLGQ